MYWTEKPKKIAFDSLFDFLIHLDFPRMADKLDTVIAEHAKEKVAYERQTAALLEKHKQKYAIYEQVIDELVKENNAKTAANWRIKQALRHINKRKIMIPIVNFF